MQQKDKFRVILDTNFFMNFLITNKVTKLDDLIENQTVKIIFSAELLNELVEMTKREKFKAVFNDKDLQKLLTQLKIFGSFVNVKSIVTVCQDIKANFLLALAKDGRADYLISSDKDLIVLETFENTKIVAPRDFLEMFQ
ncbi:MAG: putative toxin-antitoxin system toxin component, PIN family [Bacteroidia bacterium]